jgi:hypothetical protein
MKNYWRVLEYTLGFYSHNNFTGDAINDAFLSEVKWMRRDNGLHGTHDDLRQSMSCGPVVKAAAIDGKNARRLAISGLGSRGCD